MTKKEILDYLKNYKKEFAKRYGISRIGLFGSRAKDTEKPDSDIDLVIETECADYFLLYSLKEELERAFEAKVDLVRMRKRMNESLKRRIGKEAIYV